MKVRLLEIKNLSVSFGKKHVLSNISFPIEEGDWVQIKGLNGEGKTTLIKSLLQLNPYSGDIILKGKNIKEYSTKELSHIFSYVPQRLDFIPDLSLSDFLSLYDKEEKRDFIINKLSLSDLSTISLKDLSLGQLQVALLAQALLSDPEIIILDEPTSSLDVENKNKILSILKEFTSIGKTVITVNHDVNNAYAPNRIFTLSNTHLYDTNVIIGEKQSIPTLFSFPKQKVKIYLTAISLLYIISLFIPSESSTFLRSTWAILTGGVFTSLGFIFQNLFRNSLVSPNTLGITSGSLLGVIIAALLGITSPIPVSALSLLAGILVIVTLLFTKTINKKDLLLKGFSISLFFFSISLFLLFFFKNSYSLDFLLKLSGSLHITDYSSLALVPLVILPLIPMYLYSDYITAIGIDSDIAKIQGINTKFVFTLCFFLSAVSLSMVIPQSGLFFFIGIVIPNIIARIYGEQIKGSLPIFFIAGSFFVLMCDIISRLLEYYTVMPVTTGLVVLLWAPLFIFLLGKVK